MIPVFSGETANDVWKQAAEKLIKCDLELTESRLGKSYELLHVVFSINDPRQRWVTYRNPPISIAFALAEVVWILNGSNEAKVINYWNPLLKRYAGLKETYHGAYGYRIRKKFEIDQLERAYNILKNEPNSRQTVILVWSPIDDMPDASGKPVDPDIPCNICSLIKVRDSKLEWTQIIRSNDIHLGVPYNFVQYTTLQEILAGWLGIKIGLYVQLSDSLHLYYSDENKLSIIEKECIRNRDILTLNKSSSDLIFNEIYKRMKTISLKLINRDDLQKLGHLSSGFEAYDNIMFVIAAYAARKLGFEDLKDRFIDNCTNDLFRQMWTEWDGMSKKQRIEREI